MRCAAAVLCVLLLASATAGCTGKKGNDAPSSSAGVVTSSSTSSSAPAPPPKVTTSGDIKITTTLDAIGVLPHRIHWVASTPLARAEISHVDFLIDGQVLWSEGNIPYSYGDDRGYLVTSAFTPGDHNLGVHAVAKDGREGEWQARRTMVAPPALPDGLAGTWTRTVDGSKAPAKDAAGNKVTTPTPDGDYTMTFDAKGLTTTFPGSYDPTASAKTGEGFRMYDDLEAREGRFDVVGTIVTHLRDPQQADGKTWCNALNGPGWAYDWKVDGTTLTLTPAGDGDVCVTRGFVFAGTWTRSA